MPRRQPLPRLLPYRCPTGQLASHADCMMLTGCCQSQAVRWLAEGHFMLMTPAIAEDIRDYSLISMIISLWYATLRHYWLCYFHFITPLLIFAIARVSLYCAAFRCAAAFHFRHTHFQRCHTITIGWHIPDWLPDMLFIHHWYYYQRFLHFFDIEFLALPRRRTLAIFSREPRSRFPPAVTATFYVDLPPGCTLFRHARSLQPLRCPGRRTITTALLHCRQPHWLIAILLRYAATPLSLLSPLLSSRLLQADILISFHAWNRCRLLLKLSLATLLIMPLFHYAITPTLSDIIEGFRLILPGWAFIGLAAIAWAGHWHWADSCHFHYAILYYATADRWIRHATI